MTRSLVANVLLVAVSLVFAIGMTYASIELPLQLNSLLHNQIQFPGFDSGPQGEQADPFIHQFGLRWLGYGSMAALVGLMVAGLISGRSRWLATGAFALFLPIFGHFCRAMFFLAGLGVLRVLWLPLFDLSFSVLRLGEVVFVPYSVIIGGLGKMGVSAQWWGPLVLMAVGIAIITSGTLTWLRARLSRTPVASSGVYRFSRHPQYLGWIVWSYGMLIFTATYSIENFKISYVVRNSLPWLLSTFAILAVALIEELKMSRANPDAYDAYRKRAPFLLPLPPVVSRLLSWPARAILRKERPETGLQVALALLPYLVALMALSGICLQYDWPPLQRWYGHPADILWR